MERGRELGRRGEGSDRDGGYSMESQQRLIEGQDNEWKPAAAWGWGTLREISRKYKRPLLERLSIANAMTVAEMSNSGDMEPPITRQDSQWTEHQPTYNTLNPRLVISTRNARTNIKQRLREKPINNWSKLRIIPWITIKI